MCYRMATSTLLTRFTGTLTQCNKASEKLSHTDCSPITPSAWQPFRVARLEHAFPHQTLSWDLMCCIIHSLVNEVTRLSQKPSHLIATQARLRITRTLIQCNKVLEKLSHTDFSPITLSACQCNKALEKLSHTDCSPIALPACQSFGETRLVTPSHTKHWSGDLCVIITRSLAKEETRLTQKPSHLIATRAHLGSIVIMLRRMLRNSPAPPTMKILMGVRYSLSPCCHTRLKDREKEAHWKCKIERKLHERAHKESFTMDTCHRCSARTLSADDGC